MVTRLPLHEFGLTLLKAVDRAGRLQDFKIAMSGDRHWKALQVRSGDQCNGERQSRRCHANAKTCLAKGEVAPFLEDFDFQ